MRSSGLPSKGWAEMIRKVYEVDPRVCFQCGSQMKVTSLLIDYPVVDRIIDHLNLSFVADKPPPSHIAYQEVLMAAVSSAEYFFVIFSLLRREVCPISVALWPQDSLRQTSPTPGVRLTAPAVLV